MHLWSSHIVRGMLHNTHHQLHKIILRALALGNKK